MAMRTEADRMARMGYDDMCEALAAVGCVPHGRNDRRSDGEWHASCPQCHSATDGSSDRLFVRPDGAVSCRHCDAKDVVADAYRWRRQQDGGGADWPRRTRPAANSPQAAAPAADEPKTRKAAKMPPQRMAALKAAARERTAAAEPATETPRAARQGAAVPEPPVEPSAAAAPEPPEPPPPEPPAQRQLATVGELREMLAARWDAAPPAVAAELAKMGSRDEMLTAMAAGLAEAGWVPAGCESLSAQQRADCEAVIGRTLAEIAGRAS